MVAKCGPERIWHWAHQGKRLCDAWWENETEWHRAWKGAFPTSWQEIVLRAESGEKHIADVRTVHGWVIEFQNSYIELEERRSRELFYKPKIVWVVNGAKRIGDRQQVRDKQQFLRAWEEGVSVGTSSLVRMVFPDQCRLLQRWAAGPVPVFFDFGEEQGLWWLMRTSFNGWVYIAQIPRASFIELLLVDATDKFDQFVQAFSQSAANHDRARRF
jgi:hypothetical protein